MNTFLRLAFASLLIGLVGCASPIVKSSKLEDSDVAGFDIRGDAGALVYYLPTQRMKFVSTRFWITRSLLDSAKIEMAAANSLKKMQPKDVEADKQLKSAQRKFADLESAINTCRETATIELLPIEPDRSSRLEARFKHRITRDDNYVLKVDEQGLLAGGEAASTDQSLEIGKAIAATVSMFLGAPPSDAVVFSAVPPPRERSCVEYSMTTIFDPFNDDEFKKVNDDLASRNSRFKLKKNPESTPASYSLRSATDANGNTKSSPAQADGFYYRTGGPVVVMIGEGAEANFKAHTTLHAVVPQGGPVAILPVRSGMFVTTKFEYDFKKGAPSRLKVERPSEALAIAKFPVEVLKTIISAPTELIKLKVDYSTEEKSLLEAQKAVIESQTALLEAKIAADEKQKELADD